MKQTFQKLLILLIAILIVIDPILEVKQVTPARAANSSSANEEEPIADTPYNGDSTVSQPESVADVVKIPLGARDQYAGTNDIISGFSDVHSEDDRKAGIGLDEALSNIADPRIILNPDDQGALEVLYQLSGTWLAPDFEVEPEAVFEEYGKIKDKLIKEDKEQHDQVLTILGHEIGSVDDVTIIKIKNPGVYRVLAERSKEEWLSNLKDVAGEIKKQTDAALKSKTYPDTRVITLLSNVTGNSIDQVNQIFEGSATTLDNDIREAFVRKYDRLMAEFDQKIDSVKIDVRVIKLLIYLVTPKNQGGAGHWRIKVKRIVSGYQNPNKQETRESDVIYNQDTEKPAENQTAADYGQNRASTSTNSSSSSTSNSSSTNSSTNDDVFQTTNSSSTSTDDNQNILKKSSYLDSNGNETVSSLPSSLDSDYNPEAVAEVVDQDGSSYNVLVDSAQAADSGASTPKVEDIEKNISAHADGQAIDISEVDDIRCTMIKRRRASFSFKKAIKSAGVGGIQKGTNTYSKYSTRPIKLAWQTEKGYAESGGGDYYKSDTANILKGFASDSIKDLVNQFDGDVTDYEGDLSDAGFSDIVSLIGKSIFSQIINSPTSNLQGYSFGDTLKQLGGVYLADYLGLPREMVGRRFDNYDDLVEAIGSAAIEKRLDLPIGTFDGNNLRGVLKSAGQRKFEYEMNLSKGALDDYFKESSSRTLTAGDRDYIVGRAVIEEELGFQRGSFSALTNSAPATYADLIKSVGATKGNLMFRDSSYVDNTLHIILGSTDQLKNGQLSPSEYARLVGRTRQENTSWGLQQMAAKDASYELDPGTYEKAVNGEVDALIQIGTKVFAKVFATTDDDRKAFTLFVQMNLAKTPNDPTACMYDDPVYVTLDTGTATERKVVISESKAMNAGMQKWDLFDLFGCPDSNPHSFFHTIGSKIMHTAIIQQALNPEGQFKLNLTETNPQFHSSDPEKEFYITRIYNIPVILDRIKNNWKDGNKDPEYLRIQSIVNSAYTTITTTFLGSLPIANIDQAKGGARKISSSVGKLKSDVTAIQSGSNRYINKVNGTLIDLSELVRIVKEIMEGKAIPASDQITLNDISFNALSSNGNSSSGLTTLNQKASSTGNGNKSLMVMGKAALMSLLARKVTPSDFLISLAAEKIETSLDLPQNSLLYFVKNYETKGMGTIDSLYKAVGQAKIEETFNMPTNYFQGVHLSDLALEKPDFRNDLEMLYRYGAADIEAVAPPAITIGQNAEKNNNTKSITPKTSFKNPVKDAFSVKNIDSDAFKDDGTVDMGQIDDSISQEDVQNAVNEEHYINELDWLKTNDPATFDHIVHNAEARWDQQLKDFNKSMKNGDKDFEVMIDDVVANIDLRKYNDAIRTPEQDLLFRMGISGSYDALTTNNGVAWLGANSRASQIDKTLGLKDGSTRSLITGKDATNGFGANLISAKDKQILVAKMKISPTAINKWLQVIAGELPPEALDEKATDVTNIGDNKYLENPTSTSGDECSVSSLISTDGKIGASTMVEGGWFYFDKSIIDGTRTTLSFGSKEEASSELKKHENLQVSYLEEIAYGVQNLTGIGSDKLMPKLQDLANKETDAALNLDGDGPAQMEQLMGLSEGTIAKLFSRSEATDAPRPLEAYKKAVGHQVVTQAISSKLFASLGLKLDPDVFTGNEFFEVMKGNFSVLWDVAGAVVDQELGIPKGSTIKIVGAKTDNLRKCSLAELGGSIIGRYVGLDNLSLSGNIYENVGRGKLEKLLGLPSNSFSGSNIDELITNIGPVNFYVAFQYPLGKVDLDTALRAYFDPKYVDSIIRYSSTYKLKVIQGYLNMNSPAGFSGEKKSAYDKLLNDLVQRIHNTAGKALKPDGSWRKGNYEGEDKAEVDRFITKIDSIDDTFGIAKGTAANLIAGAQSESYETITSSCGLKEKDPASKDGEMVPNNSDEDPNQPQWTICTMNQREHWKDYFDIINDKTRKRERIDAPNGTCNCDPDVDTSYEIIYGRSTTVTTPEDYIKKISSKTFVSLASYGLMDLFGLDLSDERKQAVVGFLNNYSNWAKDGNTGRAKIYESLSTVFSLHLDAKAGVEDGTIKSLIENPSNASGILWTQATRKLDRQFNLDPNEKWSFSGAYQRYKNKTADPEKPQEDPYDECSVDQSLILQKESEIKQTEDQINTWISQQDGGFVDLAVANAPSGTEALMTNQNRLVNRDGYMDQIKNLAQVKEERDQLQRDLNSCKAGNRGGSTATGGMENFTDATGTKHFSIPWDKAWSVITDAASSKIHTTIWDVTKHTIDMPSADIKHFFENGDMRYFNAAITAYAANTFLDKLNNNENTAVASSVQVPYEMIKLWFIPDEGAQTYAANAAAYDYLNPTNKKTAEEAASANAPGDVYHKYGDGSFIGTVTSQDFLATNPPLGPMGSSTSTAQNEKLLLDFSNQKADASYGKPDLTKLGQQLDEINNNSQQCETIKTQIYSSVASQEGKSNKEKVDSLYADYVNDPNLSAADNEKNKKQHDLNTSKLEVCDWYQEDQIGVNEAMATAKDEVRDGFRKQAQFRMMDATLWAKDHNVFPGFSYALFEGNSYEKNAAIGTYFRMGLRNGQFFGKDIDFLKKAEENTGLNADEWLTIIAFGKELSTNMPGDQVYSGCQDTGACDALSKFVSGHSESWFGFKIDSDYAEGLVTGIATGDFGFDTSFSTHKYTDKNGRQKSAPTLGSVFRDKAIEKYSGKAFTWADKQLGWKAGTAKSVFNSGKLIFENTRALRQVSALGKQMDKTKAAMAEYQDFLADANSSVGQVEEARVNLETMQEAQASAEARYPIGKEKIDAAKGDPTKAKQILKQGIANLATSFISDQITKYIYNTFGKGIADMEDRWGLVPGSTAILISAGVGYGVATGLHMAFGGIFGAVGPASLYIALGMFILTNLFGVYRTDIQCTADGYYPSITTASPYSDSSTGIGEWDGKNQALARAKTVASSQYKAKRLILDVLEMHNNPDYKNIYASQIMTGRDEDVQELNGSISQEMCKAMKLEAVAGVCGGNTRAGVWENAQTTQYTHIGF